MAHDVFISYSTDDESVANQICSAFESQRITCWMAPRDIPPGVTWAVAIINAIKESRLFVFVLSETSNVSPPVLSELDSATNRGIPIIPVRIDNTQLSEAVEFYTARYQWLDARTPPLEKHLKQLIATVERLLVQVEAARQKKAATDEAREKAQLKAAAAKERAARQTEDTNAARIEAEKIKKEAEEAREAVIKARREAEEASLEKAKHEAEAARAQREAEATLKTLEEARAKAKEIEVAREAVTKARKEAAEAAKEQAHYEAEAVRAKREAAETLKAIEAAREKAKKKDQAAILQEQAVRVKRPLLRTGVFWVGLVFVLIASLWLVFNVLWPLDKPEIGRAEAYLGAYGGMFGLGVPILIVGVLFVGRALQQSASGRRSWFGVGVISLVICIVLAYFLPDRLQAGGIYAKSELQLPSVIGSLLPFAFLGLYSVGGGLVGTKQSGKNVENQENRVSVEAEPVNKISLKSILFWVGLIFLVGGLGWQISSGLDSRSPDEWFYWRTAFALPFTISGSYCLGRALRSLNLNKSAWFWIAVAVCPTAVLLLFTLIGASLTGDNEPMLRLMLPLLFLSVLPLVVFGLYCVVKGTTANRSSTLAQELPGASQPVIRQFLFWSGSVLFVLSQAFYWAMFLWVMPLNGVNPHLITQAIPVMAATILGMGLIWLSRRRLRDGWFWLGSEIFAFGVGALPQWINIYLNIELFPPQTSPHDLSDIGVELGLTVVVMALGSLFLWKGWPRSGVKNPLGEMLGFIITLTLASLAVTIFLLAIAD